ncbi:MAG: VWA domain-containing protein [Verrucomicrobiaceae bacterium]|nr:VWA domain-containing protein [Verrucomicrobiaceae bacterium]
MLDWEENTFIGLRALYRRFFVKPEEKRREAVRVLLKDKRKELFLLGQMIADRQVSLFETDQPTLAIDDRICVPNEFSHANTTAANHALFDLKTIAAALAMREGWRAGDGVALESRLSACADELPHLADKIEAARAALPGDKSLWSILGALPSSRSGNEVAPGTTDVPRESESVTITTEMEGKGQTDVTVLPEREDDGPGHDMPTHTFEKVETVEEYDGQSRKSDAADELDEHAEALREVNMQHVIRSTERASSIYRADIILDGLSLEVADGEKAAGIPYPEWDFKRGSYRPAWCFVQEMAARDADAAWLGNVTMRRKALVWRLKRQFAALTTEWLKVKRQSSGSEFDIDAVIESEVRRRTGGAASEAVYTDTRRDLQDVAALILLDLSYSTDAWLDGTRVLDTIRDSVFCVGEVLDDFIEKFAVAGFSSNTRRSCHFHQIKGFREPWRSARGRLGSVQPGGYTRIGAALRHAQELLERQHARRKIVLLITDGRPCDYDRYEGNHGIHDVKKAIEVGKQHGIATHAFAIEKRAAEYFPRMFTQHHFDIIPAPERLAQTMCKLFARLRAS